METELSSLLDLPSDSDSKSTNLLLNALQVHSQEGFDYLKYKRAVEQLMDMGMDQTTALKSALATAGTLGITKEKLLQSIKHYQKVMDNEKRLFDEALNQQMQKRVASKLEEADYLKDKVEEYEQKIRELKTKIVQMKQKLDESGEKIDVEKSKIIDTKNQFEQSYIQIVRVLKSDLDMIHNL